MRYWERLVIVTLFLGCLGLGDKLYASDVFAEGGEVNDTNSEVVLVDNKVLPRTELDSLSIESFTPDIDSIKVDSVVERRNVFKRIGDYFKDSNKDETLNKAFDFSIIGGPHYSSAVQLGLGLVAAGLYRVDRSDTLTAPSNVSFVGDISTSGFWMLGVRGNNFFSQANHRLDYSTYFFSMPTKLWGIGYDMGRNGSNETEYRHLQTEFKVDYMYRLIGDLYAGTSANFAYAEARKFEEDFDNNYYLDGQKHNYTNFGLGLFLLFDSRDYVTAAHQGWFFKLENIFFPKFFGNDKGFNRTELTLDFYHRVWKDAVLAYDLHALYNSYNVPWMQMAQMGGSSRMRGYYAGRYRDKGLVEIQAELRQRVWRRIGVAGWVGAGNVFPKLTDFDFSHTLPNFGVGLRWEFKNRVNVRLDVGFGKGQTGFVFNINEAF